MQLESDNPDVESKRAITSHCAGIQLLEERVSRFIRFGEGSFEELIFGAHSFQRTACAPYGAYCSNFAIPTSWIKFRRFRSAFRYAPIRSFAAVQTVRSFRTSGTTGEGYGEHHFRTLELYRLAALTAGDMPACRVISSSGWPSSEESPPSLSCMAGWLAPRERFFRVSGTGFWKVISAEREPLVLFGTALASWNFFERLGDRQLALPRRSGHRNRYAGTNRSLPKTELYSLFQRHFGLDDNEIWNEYGMTELSSQFYAPEACGARIVAARSARA